MTIHMRNLTTATTASPSSQPHKVRQEALRLGLELYSRLSADGAARLIDRLAFTPQRLPMPSRYEYLLDQADSHTQLHHGAHTLPVYSWGDGPTILGVHGWSGAGIQFGAYIEPLVEAGYRVVLYDAPAHGRAQGERTDLYEMAEVLTRVAHHVGPLHGIIAHSVGALIAGRALVDGLAARKLVLLAPPANLSDVVDGLGKQLGLSASALSGHRRRMEARFGADVWSRLSLEQLAPQLMPQGLVVIDSDDREINEAESARVYHHWPDAGLLRTAGLGHHRLLWHPDAVEPVTDFLTR
ncbi:alpha/beta fold hydrolase [Marinobacter mobilis]|uniref:Alpha/beta hydrolase family protein n=1 Tax=Marinobacter mobilis TaxID=488533 RepID=A0A1H2WP62_9GAMM|nr:alpha/beta hydrolase [Marinobacter mobilis]SDW82440.1 Alpha/beta hydrolase family protein [Marinobacter mobilis]